MQQQKKNILITWWAGFVWSNLCKRLLDNWHSIICLDNLYTGSLDNIRELMDHPNFQYINHDVTSPLWEFFMDRTIDQIYHLACPASPPHYQKDPLYTLDTCYTGMKHILDLATTHHATVLQASTSEVYGDPYIHPQVESYWGNVNTIGIRSCYDEWKRVAETLCYDYHRKYATDIRIIRIFNTYGPFMDPKDWRVVSNFIMQALRNEDITIYGDGSQTRSFQYIDDLLDGMIAMMNNTQWFLWPVNIGTPYEFTMIQLAQILLELIPESTSKLVYNDLPSDDPKQRKADTSLAKEKFWREPTIWLHEGLKKTIDYFRSKI